MGMKAALIALALELCPWQPATVPPLILLNSPHYEIVAGDYGLDPAPPAFLDRNLANVIFMRVSTANERILCHEWRHIVEPDWHHE